MIVDVGAVFPSLLRGPGRTTGSSARHAGHGGCLALRDEIGIGQPHLAGHTRSQPDFDNRSPRTIAPCEWPVARYGRVRADGPPDRCPSRSVLTPLSVYKINI